MQSKYRCFKADVIESSNTLLSLELVQLGKKNSCFTLCIHVTKEGQIVCYQTQPSVSLRTLFNLNFYLLASTRFIHQGRSIKSLFHLILNYYFGDCKQAAQHGLDNLSWLLMMQHPNLKPLCDYTNDPLTFKLLCRQCATHFPDTSIWRLKRHLLLSSLIENLRKKLAVVNKTNQVPPAFIQTPMSKNLYRHLQKLTGIDMSDAAECINAISLFLSLYTNKMMQKSIRHQKRLNYAQLKDVRHTLSMSHVELLDFSFEQLSLLGKQRLNYAYIDDILRMQVLLDIPPGFTHCRSAQALIDYHNALIQQLQARAEQQRLKQDSQAKALENTIFPPTPLKQHESIEPLLSYADLVKEGKTMHHCIGVVDEYTLKGMRGTMAFFRMLSPQRATLALEIKSCGDITISELVLKNNKAVSTETIDLVQNWIKSSMMSSK